ncbi:DUF6371 domain-containing protein [Maribacter sp. 2307UL18-2]|uniref:DUF6371 domain-containing protein n=1 Tax=Maribacter sp. 2307UL18-2 TaxID=3386274 RepID=UPI0039BD2552
MSELEERMINSKENHFFTWLGGLIGIEGLKVLKERYKLGTSTIYNGLVSFPQIDAKGRLHRIKEMRYNPNNGKRSKMLGSQRWAFEKRLFPDMNLEQVYFGSHLIVGNDKPIALVESEKTALVCSHFMSKFIWLATGSLGMLSNERCKHLRGRELFLFPDLGATEVWAKKTRYLKGFKGIKVSKYLEENANEYNLKEGDDLADLFINELKNRNE